MALQHDFHCQSDPSSCENGPSHYQPNPFSGQQTTATLLHDRGYVESVPSEVQGRYPSLQGVPSGADFLAPSLTGVYENWPHAYHLQPENAGSIERERQGRVRN